MAAPSWATTAREAEDTAPRSGEGVSNWQRRSVTDGRSTAGIFKRPEVPEKVLVRSREGKMATDHHRRQLKWERWIMLGSKRLRRRQEVADQGEHQAKLTLWYLGTMIRVQLKTSKPLKETWLRKKQRLGATWKLKIMPPLLRETRPKMRKGNKRKGGRSLSITGSPIIPLWMFTTHRYRKTSTLHPISAWRVQAQSHTIWWREYRRAWKSG
mmetsp:Transcript_21046/g.60320  ORF Transcript_21046/g.60320 Transcript_21046/m.60320 type:complete len:212 (-) Transcript_21046:1429-2064(-)